MLCEDFGQNEVRTMAHEISYYYYSSSSSSSSSSYFYYYYCCCYYYYYYYYSSSSSTCISLRIPSIHPFLGLPADLFPNGF
jgi:hypothetical protein